MRRISGLVSLVVAVVVLAGPAGLAQKPAPPGGQKQDKPRDDQIEIGTLEVRLPITVKDKDKNKFIPDLVESNFEVYEDGKKQKIQRFVAPSKLPLNIAVLMDTSNSVKLKLPFEKDAAEDFIATVTTYRRKDQVLFATFDSNVELHQDFTDAQEPLIRAIRKVKSGGYTRMYDGVYRIIEEKMSSLRGSDARRVIVVLSDGEDTASDRSLKEAIAIAQRYDVTIFGISTKNFKGIASGMVENADDKDLRLLCEQTGGQVFLPSQKIELFRAFSEVAQDLRQEYVIYYTPDNQEKTGKHREIKVKLVSLKGHLFHKVGYDY
ncbi:MAG TPA: VWA domain-containing protein [Blastocatellia bacterium]|nr:VWA domain-containing protein [Blastocatellia bacterium]